METKNFTDYLGLIAVVILFVVVMLYSVFLYLGWSETPVEIQDSVEINLPVIEWQKYSNLSKQYENNTIDQNNK